MDNVTVDLKAPSLYVEPDGRLYRFKRRLTFKNIFNAIRSSVKKEQEFSLLEIGTGAGFFITFLESEFPKAKFTGIEYDPRLVSLAQTKVKDAIILQGNAEDFDLGDDKYDIIVSLQVIEHLYNPELMLALVKKHLKPEGTFIFTTPNLGCLSRRVMRDKWHGFCEDHVSLKSFDEWKVFAEENGFSSIYCGSTFFSGIPLLNKFPMGILNWGLLFLVGSLKWKQGESFIGVFKHSGKLKGEANNDSN